jgi:hypothetical protein
MPDVSIVIISLSRARQVHFLSVARSDERERSILSFV